MPTQPLNHSTTQLFIGLGNPGPGYADNRHNFGFLALDAIAKVLKAPDFKDKFHGQVSKLNDLYLFKPVGFMNNSGVAASEVAKFYKISLDNIYVFHDELDLELGKIKIKQGGGDGGHNGIKSLDAHLGNGYWRVRLGINHPGHKDLVHDHVLSNFSKNEASIAKKIVKIIAENIETLVQGDRNLFLTRYFESFDSRAKPEKKPAKKI